MIYRIRSSRIWEWSIFYVNDDDPFTKWFNRGAWSVVFLLIGFVVMMSVADYDSGGDVESANAWLLLIFTVIGFVCSGLGKVSLLYNVPRGLTYNDQHTLRKRARFYLDLPSADKALYPYNILRTISNPLLDRSQRMSVGLAMKKIEDKIVERERIKAELSRRHIDIDSLVEGLVDSTRSVQLEIDTYKEYM